MTDAERSIEICMEQARKAFVRMKEFQVKHGPVHIGVQLHGDRGAMAYQCASEIAKEFGLADPDIAAAAQ